MYEEKGVHARIYPYMTQVIQYSNLKPDGTHWIAKNRSTATRNERRGYGPAMVRVWTPSEWEPVLEGVNPADRCEDFPCCGHEAGDCTGALYGPDSAIVAQVELEHATGHSQCDHADGMFNCEQDEDEEGDVDWDEVNTEQVYYPEGDY